jgi:uncharacterized protein
LEIIGYIFAFFVGVIINLLGGGGSTLSIPIFVYLFRVDSYLATSYSLFLVGTSSWLASINNIRKGNILFKQALYFAAPALIVSLSIRRFVLPNLPDIIQLSESIAIQKSTLIMSFFALITLSISLSIIRSSKNIIEHLPTNFNYSMILMQAALVGIITGFIGVSGGFLLVPTMVLLAKIPMKNAVATTLIVVAITTSTNFIGDLFTSLKIDWSFLLTYVGIALSGVLFSNLIKNKISNKSLQKIFGYFILFLALLVVWLEILK